MLLSEFKNHLSTLSELTITLPDNKSVPKHFHITEVGQIDKNFIDCGGTVRSEKKVIMQLWTSLDTWHRLEPSKLLSIIELSEKKLGIGDHEVEIEYQGKTIEKFGVDFKNGQFQLVSTHTDCLAKDLCAIPDKIVKTVSKVTSCCTPGGGCC